MCATVENITRKRIKLAVGYLDGGGVQNISEHLRTIINKVMENTCSLSDNVVKLQFTRFQWHNFEDLLLWIHFWKLSWTYSLIYLKDQGHNLKHTILHYSAYVIHPRITGITNKYAVYRCKAFFLLNRHTCMIIY